MPDQLLFGEPITHPLTFNVIWDKTGGKDLPEKYKDIPLKPMTLKEFLSEPRTQMLVIYIGDGKVKVGDLPEKLRCTELPVPEKPEGEE